MSESLAQNRSPSTSGHESCVETLMRYNTPPTCNKPVNGQKVSRMSLDNNADNGPQPFIREKGLSRRRTSQPEPAPKPGASGGVGCALVGLVIVLVAVLIGI